MDQATVTNPVNRIELQIREWLTGFDSTVPVVVVPVFNALDDVLECLDSLLASTPRGIPILVLDDASTDAQVSSTLEPLAHEKCFAYARKPTNSGFVGTVNLAFAACAPHDVIVVNSDVVVPPHWLERLQAAAYCRSNIATATPLTNHGTILSVPYRNRPVPDLLHGMTTAQIDDRIRAFSLCLHPIIPGAIGHCVYFRRSALEAVGYFDETFAPGYGEEVDFSQRAVAVGFSHVAADDLFVYHKGSQSFRLHGQKVSQRLQSSHEKIINARYPGYHAWVVNASNDPASPLALALERARAALLGYRIAIDATRVDGKITGTQVLILELVRALTETRSHSAHLAVIVNDRVSKEALLGVDQLVDQVLRMSDFKHQTQPSFDLVHRPSQVFSIEDLQLLQRVASRFIVSQLDSISFSNPSYADSPDEWQRFRSLTQLVFASADGVAFISQDALQDATHHGLLIPDERVGITYVGIDHQLHSADALAPAGVKFEGQPFILVVGTNFRHKNRPFALRLFKALVQQYRWSGQLVFAGPAVAFGGSEAEEALELSRSPDLSSRVHDLGAVNEPQKKWLLQNASLVLYPSIYEGFGIVPFEAAAVGTPALTRRATALNEVLGDQVVYLDTCDPEVGAEVAWSLLSNPELAQRQVEAINARAVVFTWEAVAKQTWNFYNDILKLPLRSHELTRLGEWSRSRQVAMKSPHLLPLAEKLSLGWPGRIGRSFKILRTRGLNGLVQEIRQYIRWLHV